MNNLQNQLEPTDRMLLLKRALMRAHLTRAIEKSDRFSLGGASDECDYDVDFDKHEAYWSAHFKERAPLILLAALATGDNDLIGKVSVVTLWSMFECYRQDIGRNNAQYICHELKKWLSRSCSGFDAESSDWRFAFEMVKDVIAERP